MKHLKNATNIIDILEFADSRYLSPEQKLILIGVVLPAGSTDTERTDLEDEG